MSEPTVFFCTAEDMHPYNCDGEGKCIHCDRRRTEDHDPDKCALCRFMDGDDEIDGIEFEA